MSGINAMSVRFGELSRTGLTDTGAAVGALAKRLNIANRYALVTLLSLSPITALADPICDAITDMLASQTHNITLPSPFPSDVKCSSALAQSGGRFTYCAWPFDYRARAANDAFRQLVDAVPGCLGATLAGKDDQNVNHPDFYDLKVFKTGTTELSVSLKDKANLSKSFVFLRARSTR